MIDEVLKLIKEQTGLELELCNYFTGIKERGDEKYFNVMLKQRTSESNDYDKLERFAKQYNLIRVEPNGLKRVAIFSEMLKQEEAGSVLKADYEGFYAHVKEEDNYGIPRSFRDLIRIAKQYNCEIPKVVDGKLVFETI